MSNNATATPSRIGRGTGRGVASSPTGSSGAVAAKTVKATVATPPQKRLPTPDAANLTRASKPLPPPPKSGGGEFSDSSSESIAPPLPKSIGSQRSNNRVSVFNVGRGGAPPEIRTKPVAIATDDYDAENHRELSFKRDDKIYVTFWSPHTTWWKGWVNGETGYFPKESVKPLFDVDQNDAPSKTNTVRDNSTQHDKKRRQLILSIASTEEQHVKDISLIPETMMRDMQNYLSSSDMAEIFGNIETIVSESKSMLSVFLRKVKTEEPVGDIFLQMAHMFEEEVVPWATRLLTSICIMERARTSSSEFQQCLDNLTEKCVGLSLYEWLAKPVRRTTETLSIAKMLLMKTPSDNADYKGEKVVYSFMRKKANNDLNDAIDILGRVKEMIRVPQEDLDNLLKIVSLQSALDGQDFIVSQYRKVLREFSLQEVLRGGKKLSNRKIVLMNDLLVVVKVKRTGLGQGSLFPLNKLQLVPVADVGQVRNMVELALVGPKKERRRFSLTTSQERDTLMNVVQVQSNATMKEGIGPIPVATGPASATMTSDTKKGIFQKLRSARSMSIGGEDPMSPPDRSASSSNLYAAPVSGSPDNTRMPRGSSSTGLSVVPPPSSMNKSPRPGSEGKSLTQSSPAPLREPPSRDAPLRESMVRTATDRKSPREEMKESGSVDLRSSGVLCAACGENIVGNALNSKGKFYHNACYKCTECSKSLVGVPFAEKKGLPYCKDCAIANFAEPCAGCGKMITGQFVSAFGDKYHPACFVCAGGCGTNVSRGYAKKNGKAYCRACAKNLEQ